MSNSDATEFSLFEKGLFLIWVISGLIWTLTSITPTVPNDIVGISREMLSNPFYFMKILVVDFLLPKELIQWRLQATYLDQVSVVAMVSFILACVVGAGIVLNKMTKTERIHLLITTVCAVSAIAGLIGYAHLIGMLPQHFLISILAIFTMLPITACFALIPAFLAHKVGLLESEHYNEVIRFAKLTVVPGDEPTSDKA